ncbi:MAG: hypothetical protein KZQ99_00015 [Candidatus Thiodiazotropha sp. (ex Dulcina madagascariensis)]|nr:hypothetical protein [Candidatus Thiodiazotropha sp. (ex Dulcina madagascariensis)]
MNIRTILTLALSTTLYMQSVQAYEKVYDEDSLRQAFELASSDSRIEEIIFKKNAHIILNAPVIYTGSQPLKLVGHGAVIDGSAAGGFVLDADLTAITEDGALIFNTAAGITIRNLSIENSASRGIVVNIPDDATDDDLTVNLHRVHITNSALFGLHIDDNANEFDDGALGSAIGIDLKISRSTFTGNGTGAIDYDGIRVDERDEGDINAVITYTKVDGNGGDGIELDEAGEGDVEVSMAHVTLNGNGFYNEDDLDDGFDIDEAGEGDIEARLKYVTIQGNLDEGLDFDEAGEGDVELRLGRISAANNSGEAIKVDEQDAGHIEAKLKNVMVKENGDDGIQFTELGEGKIEATLNRVSACENDKYGIKLEQWVIEDEDISVEDSGSLVLKRVVLSGNGKGDEIATNNITIK